MTTGELIAGARLNAGLTQSELALRAGTSQAAIARYEADRVSPSVSTLERVLRAAGEQLVLSTTQNKRTDMSTPKAQLVRRYKSEIHALARRHGIANVRLFGSVARGEDTELSDIDFLVEIEGERVLSISIVFQEELEKLLGCTVDVAPVSILKPSVAQNAIREAIAI